MEIFRNLAIIIFAAEFMGLLAKKCKAPQVVGQIIAGLLIGPAIFNIVQPSDFLNQMAEIGVVLLMFSAGLETDLKELIRTGPLALAVACVGVAVPHSVKELFLICFYVIVFSLFFTLSNTPSVSPYQLSLLSVPPHKSPLNGRDHAQPVWH